MGTKKIKILYLDDEENNLLSFKATFRHEFDIFITPAVKDAITILEANPDIQILLSDQRMPELTGVEFFESIRDKFPKPVRILITGYTDIESVISAINRGHIFRYIRKPWDENEMRSAFEEAHKFYTATHLLNQKSDEIKQAYDELGKFSYSVAHELKGPLMSIQESIKIAQSDQENLDQRELLLELALKSTSKLLSFVENMFDYYQMKQGELQIEDINLKQLLNDYEDIYSVVAKLNHVQFEISLAEDGQTFRNDISKLRIILNNLLSNAFKYKNKNSGNHFVKLELVSKSGLLSMVVSDNGIGIKDKYLNNIFDMFYRATTQEPGSGFGLYNVKDAVSKINGNIEVSSVFEKGSVFKVTIPTK